MRKVSRTGKITIDKVHHYYISPLYANQKVKIKRSYKEVIAYDILSDTEITRMSRLFGSTVQTQIDWSQYLSVIASKPNSINNISFVNLFSEKLRTYLFSLEKNDLKQFLNELLETNKRTDNIFNALEVIEQRIQN